MPRLRISPKGRLVPVGGLAGVFVFNWRVGVVAVFIAFVPSIALDRDKKPYRNSKRQTIWRPFSPPLFERGPQKEPDQRRLLRLKLCITTAEAGMVFFDDLRLGKAENQREVAPGRWR